MLKRSLPFVGPRKIRGFLSKSESLGCYQLMTLEGEIITIEEDFLNERIRRKLLWSEIEVTGKMTTNDRGKTIKIKSIECVEDSLNDDTSYERWQESLFVSNFLRYGGA